jgi:hypothetical protein
LDLASSEIQQFIRDHENDDEKALILKHKEILGVPAALIADQIAGRRKAKEKLPLYYQTEGIVYPPSINLEQSSSEQTARFKSQLVSESLEHLNTCADLTGGLGIDTFFFSQIFQRVTYIEPDWKLLQLAKHNHHTLEVDSISYENLTAEEFFGRAEKFDFAYIDPSRRSADKKIFSLTDSTPNILGLQSKIFDKTENVLVKTSPLLDLQLGISELKFVREVYVVAVNNEVKEVLFFLENDFSGEPAIHAVNLKSERTEQFEFKFSEEKSLQVTYDDPQTYLFEPNAAILKSGAFKSIAKTFELGKIGASTHLYTSAELRKQFPGRIFKIQAFVKPEPKRLQEHFNDGKANIITRNYPLTVEELKKRTRLSDGGDKYLIGFSGQNEKFLCAAERIQ